MDGSPDALLGNAAGASGKGCGCKHGGCVKKYCECFQQGRMCGDKCECFACKNGGLEALKQLSAGGADVNEKDEVSPIVGIRVGG